MNPTPTTSAPTLTARTSDAASSGGQPIRLLVIDRDGLARDVREIASEAEVHAVPTWLAAMGEVTRRPVDAVIGPLDALSGLIEPTARGLRRLLPDAALVVTTESNEPAETAGLLKAGFDHCVRRPLDGNEFSRILKAFDGQSTPKSSVDQTLDDAQLGDTDLAEAVMIGKETLRDMAIRIVRARSGLAGVALTPRETAALPPPENVRVALRYRQSDFGTLHAPPPARAEQLAPWADWLGRWLALGEQHDQLKHLAMHDELTGAWNRRYFNRFLARILGRAAKDRSQVTVMVFDIDDFKRYNDRYGHAAGDEILRESARLMQAVVREHDVVARIGGDEFAVIFWDAEGPRRANSAHPQDVAKAARRFQQAICTHKFPKLLDDAPGTLTISGGLASFPWDGQNPEQLLARADEMALQSKRQGKNAITFGPGALRENEAACGDSA